MATYRPSCMWRTPSESEEQRKVQQPGQWMLWNGTVGRRGIEHFDERKYYGANWEQAFEDTGIGIVADLDLDLVGSGSHWA